MDADVIVVGAGMAGLSCAIALHQRGVDVTVLEKRDGVGGRVRTDVVDGFRLDRGFQILLTAYPEARRQLDLDSLDLRPFQPGALVRIDGRFHRVADPVRDPRRLLATLRAPVGGLRDKARLGLLLRRVTKADPASLLRRPETSTRAHLRELGFSDEIVERLWRPWFGGVLLDPELSTSSRMFEILFRSFAAGDAAVPATGMGAISEQLAGRLPAGCIRLGTTVTKVGDGEVSLAEGGDPLRARAVVVATEGPTAARLTGVPDPGSRSSTSIWFAAERPPIDEPVLMIDGEGRGPATSAAVLSAAAPNYAPPGAALIGASIPGALAPDRAEDVRAQMRTWFGRQVDGWRVLRTDAIRHGLPNQRPPMRPKRAVALHPGLFVCGDHRDTGSIQGALYSGRRAAASVVDQLDAGP
jgi:phytoene dehydrogenase-like protein